jgi:cytochrome d ubiquinol oxidase subunit II
VASSFIVRPDFTRNFTAHPVLLLWPAAALAALVVNRRSIGRGTDRRAFIASSACIAGVLASVAAGLYPVLLPASGDGTPLDIYNAAAPAQSLRIALAVYLSGLAIVSVYLVAAYRVWRGKSGAVYH